jgi:hypothetical protein
MTQVCESIADCILNALQLQYTRASATTGELLAVLPTPLHLCAAAAAAAVLRQGVLLAAEGPVKRAARSHGLALAPWVSHLAVLLALGVTADTFFWPPLLQLGPPLRASAAGLMPQQVALWLGWV